MSLIRLLALLALLVLPSHEALAAFAAVAHTAQGGAASTSTSVTTSGINTTGSSLIIVTCSFFNTAATNISVSDSSSNSWGAKVVTGGAGSGQLNISAFVVVSPTTSSSQTFTCTIAGGGQTFPSIAVDAFSGSATASATDKSSGAHTASASTLQPGSVTPAQNNEMIYNAVTIGGGSVSSISTGTTTNNLTSPGTVFDAMTTAWSTQTSAAATNPTWTFSGAEEGAAVQLTFKIAGGTPLTTVTFVPGLF